jgi:hypothetical protein
LKLVHCFSGSRSSRWFPLWQTSTVFKESINAYTPNRLWLLSAGRRSLLNLPLTHLVGLKMFLPQLWCIQRFTAMLG